MIGQTVSHYKILEKLGEGGMGVVYKAEDMVLERPVALKFLPSELTSDEAAKRRFIHEARAASALDHDNIGVVYEVDETNDGRSFICMAYYPGETLKERIEQGPIEPDTAVRYATQIAKGLQRAHEAGIVHRDIKPANLLLTKDGVVKIVDFGLAKLSSDVRSSKSGRMAGTAAYMSPEQVRGVSADGRSDLFSLGVVLYEMLSGVRPFAGEHEAAIFYSIAHLDPSPLSGVRPGVPPALDRITQRLLQKDPGTRYQSAAEVIADLHSARTGVASMSTTWTGQAVLAVRSRPRLVPIAVGSVAVLGVLAWLLAGRATRQPFEFAPSKYILVADFRNQTPDSFFNHSLTEEMKVALAQSPRLNLLPTDRVHDALRRMQLPPDHPLDEATSLALARREGAPVVVAGSVSQVGKSYTLTCRILNAGTGDLLDLVYREAPQIEKVVSEMDQLSKDVRERLGESIGQIAATAKPLQDATTPSLEALELHSRAMILEGQGNYRDAALLEGKAVSVDPLFTMAISELSYIQRKLGNDSAALSYHRRVLPLIDRVTDRERFLILTIYYGPSFELDFPKARESIRQLVVQFPNNAEGFSVLGWLEMYDGNAPAAIDAFKRSLALDSISFAPTIFDNWGFALALAGDAEGARNFYRKSKALRPRYYPTDAYIAQASWMAGELDSAEHSLITLVPVDDFGQSLSARMQLASLYEFEGRLQDARQVCLNALAYCSWEHQPAEESYFHYMLGELAAESHDWNLYAREMKEAERLSRPPFFELPLIGASYARNGRVRDAVSILGKIGAAATADPYFNKRRGDYERIVNGEIDLRKELSSQAARQFQGIGRVHGGDPLYLLAQLGLARAAAMQGDSNAVTLYRNLLGHRGESVMAFVRSIRNGGFWTRELWPEADLALGRLFAQRKEVSLAEEHLRSCLQVWGRADRGDPRVREATAILSQLTKGR
jgi:serine/threonine protein kinase/tetratricopeptide (TPR) repeat protein